MSGATFWDRLYGREGPAWGSLPDPELLEYASMIPRGRALDLGMGDGRNAFFLKPGELKGLFPGLEIVSYSEGYSLDVSHGEPHYHGWASLVARKPGAGRA